MKICTFASGSSGNCAFLAHGETKILIDAGISMRRIKNSLDTLGYTFQDLDGIFITHDHSDHIKALKMLLKYQSIPIFASQETANGITCQLPEARGRINRFLPTSVIALGELEVLSFPTSHDTPGSVGYRINAGGKSFAVVTDTGFVSENILAAVLGADTVMLEANHDVDMLMHGPYPYYLRERILSRYGHLSNSDSAKFAAVLASSGTKQIILAHLSSKNNTPQLAMSEVGKELASKDILLSVAPRSEMGEIYII